MANGEELAVKRWCTAFQSYPRGIAEKIPQGGAPIVKFPLRYNRRDKLIDQVEVLPGVLTRYEDLVLSH